jgi:hypothetical protein
VFICKRYTHTCTGLDWQQESGDKLDSRGKEEEVEEEREKSYWDESVK